MSFFYYLFIVAFSAIYSEAARILAAFPTPSISHQVVFRPLIHELARRGHEVVVITTDPAFPKGKAPANLTEIDVHDTSYGPWKAFLAAATGEKGGIITQIQTAIDLYTIIFEEQIKNEEVQRIIKDKNISFDLLLTEACVRQALSLSYLYKVPVIQVSSFGAAYDNYETIGAPTHPLLYPSVLHQRLYKLTLWEKITELITHFRLCYMYEIHEEEENEMVKRIFGPEAPTLKELGNNVHMLFLNVNPIWEGNYPVPPGVVYMGGLHQNPEKELPQDIKSYLDSSKNGVIYMSFGTNTNPSELPPEKIQIFIKVFSQLSYDVLWKWDKDELPGISKNVRIGKWFPQSDLLRHPKIKVFITQGGLQSTDEAITAVVPLIGIPMLGDQWHNVDKYVHHKIGLRLDLDLVTEERFRDAINTVIEDKSYRNSIARLRTLMRDQPMKPLERAVWWTEYVLRHGGASHLRSPAANISWTEYLEIELVLTIIALLSLGFLALILLIYVFIKAVSIPKSKLKSS